MVKLALKNQDLSCYIRLMRKEDVAQVTEIDREAFPTLRPPINYHNELQNRLAHYVVACSREASVDEAVPSESGRSGFTEMMSRIGRLLGYNRHTDKEAEPLLRQYIFGFAGLWMMADEAHIMNIAVREEYRGGGIGELLLISLIDLALELKAQRILLEVRVSNTAAQKLYAKYGFETVGLRHAYYTDNKEDAVVMSTGDITTALFRTKVSELRQAHSRKWGIDCYEIAR